MNALGKHILLEFYGCDAGVLNNPKQLQQALLDAANRATATVIDSLVHQFSPHGVSVVVMVAESHFALHTWPEHGYAAIDLFTCSDRMNEQAAWDHLEEVLRAQRVETQTVDRGTAVPR